MCTNLSPSQNMAARSVSQNLEVNGIAVLKCGSGMGRSTILRQLHTDHGGDLLGLRHFMQRLKINDPSAIEETFSDMMERSLLGHDLVIVDDLHLIVDVVEHYNYTRSRLFSTALKALLESAQERGKKFIFAVDENDPPTPIRHRALPCEVKDFMPEDYECICRAYLSTNAAGRIDFMKLHRFAPKLTAHQLRNTCVGVDREQPIDTEVVTEFLASQNMTSNVEIEEVAPVDWKDLKGVDDVIEALETKIAFPFDSGQIAADLTLNPKRGVLLAGPPGTGKTTIFCIGTCTY